MPPLEIILADPVIRWRGYPPKPNEPFKLEEDCVFVLGDLTLTAKAGTVTDGASIPRFFWRLVGAPIMGPHFPAAVMHDAAYEGTLTWVENGQAIHVSKQMADDMFDRLLALPQMKVAPWRRKLMVYAVRTFGQSAWDNNRKKNE